MHLEVNKIRWCPLILVQLLVLVDSARDEFRQDYPLSHKKTHSKHRTEMNSYYTLDDERICRYPNLIELLSLQGPSGSLIQKMCKSFPQKQHTARPPRSRTRRKSRRPGRKGRKQLNDRARKKLDSLMKSTRCRPIRQMVDIENPHPNLYSYMPCKVVVKKCSGCCQSDLMECIATKTKNKKFDVLKLALHQSKRHHRKRKDMKGPVQKIYVTEDKLCECKCKVKESDCGPGQIYDPHNCHCKCPETSYTSCHHKKVWSQSHCQCMCKEKDDCTTGMSFNPDICECELKFSLEDVVYEERS